MGGLEAAMGAGSGRRGAESARAEGGSRVSATGGQHDRSARQRRRRDSGTVRGTQQRA